MKKIKIGKVEYRMGLKVQNKKKLTVKKLLNGMII